MHPSLWAPVRTCSACARPGTPAGGHNVIIGLHDYLQRWHPGSTVIGFLGGPAGVMNNKYKILREEMLVS